MKYAYHFVKKESMMVIVQQIKVIINFFQENKSNFRQCNTCTANARVLGCTVWFFAHFMWLLRCVWSQKSPDTAEVPLSI